MSRLFLTNCKNWNDSIRAEYGDIGLEINGTITENIYLTTCRKIDIKSYNLVEFKDGFIACCGTLIFDEISGEKALRALYEYLKEHNITEARKHLMGMYAVAYKHNDEVRAFVDETATYSLYYYHDGSNYIISNVLLPIEKCVAWDTNKDAIIEELASASIINNETYFMNVFRVMYDECLVIDTSNDGFRVDKIGLNVYSLDETEFDSIVEKLADTLLKYAKRFHAIDINPCIFLTGGVDSRLVLAAYWAAGIKPVVCNWQDSTGNMNTFADDQVIAHKLAEKIGVETEDYDVSYDPINGDSSVFKKYGEFALLYGGNAKWHSILKGNKLGHFVLGYFGETLKAWEGLDSVYHTHMTIEEYWNLYMNYTQYPGSDGSVSGIIESRNKVLVKLKELADRYGMNQQDLSQEDCMILFYEHRLHADAKTSNFMNQFGFCSILFAEKEIADYINQIPYKFKQDFKLNLALTRKLCPELLDIEYFTRCHYVRFDSKNMELKESLLSKMKPRIARVLRKSKLGRKALYIYQSRKGQPDSRKASEKNRYVRLINDSCWKTEIRLDVDVDTFTNTVEYIKILMYVRMLDYLRETPNDK